MCFSSNIALKAVIADLGQHALINFLRNFVITRQPSWEMIYRATYTIVKYFELLFKYFNIQIFISLKLHILKPLKNGELTPGSFKEPSIRVFDTYLCIVRFNRI